MKSVFCMFPSNTWISKLNLFEIISFGKTPLPHACFPSISMRSPVHMCQVIDVRVALQTTLSANGYYDWSATFLCLNLAVHNVSEQHIAPPPARSEFVLSVPPSTFTEALKSVQHVATLFPVAVPSQQDTDWPGLGVGDLRKGWLLGPDKHLLIFVSTTQAY